MTYKYSYRDRVEFSSLLGKTLKRVINNDNDELIFVTDNDEYYIMNHQQDCCEHVYIEDIEGDLDSLVGNPLLVAEEVNDTDRPPLSDYHGSYKWTFYKLATIKGHVDIRWYGSSNGYYSESVDIYKATLV